jgi:hypothetical protein
MSWPKPLGVSAMSRPVTTSPPTDNDAVAWFFRLERAVHEQDFGLANEARRQLARLGWDVTRQECGRSRQAAPRQGGGA